MSPKPTNTGAWTPPPTYIPVPSAVSGIEGYAPNPKAVEKDEASEYECPNCGSAIAYDVSASGTISKPVQKIIRKG